MEKTERESTQDFMINVDSFSQLPFIRPTPHNRQQPKSTSIRLFGIEFGNDSAATTVSIEASDNNSSINNYNDEGGGGGGESGAENRRFECHYCCRNFPTSQALGGHQNAHRRERQHAKQAHLHDTRHVYYGLGVGSAPAPPPPPPMSYIHSWRSNCTSTVVSPRFYGTYSSNHQVTPITGSPTGFWRIPAVQSSAAINRDGFSDHDPLPLVGNGDWLTKSTVTSGSGTQKSSVQDHVSLDLHL